MNCSAGHRHTMAKRSVADLTSGRNAGRVSHASNHDEIVCTEVLLITLCNQFKQFAGSLCIVPTNLINLANLVELA